MPETTSGEFDCAVIEGNHPDFYKTVFDLLRDEFQYERTYISLRKYLPSRRPVTTNGFTDIVAFVATSIVLPIFAGTLANLLSSLVLEKRKVRGELTLQIKNAEKSSDPSTQHLELRAKRIIAAQENDVDPSDNICLRIRVGEERRDLVFQGTIREVAKQLRGFRKTVLRSVRITSDCHIAMIFGDQYMDATLEKDGTGEISSVSRRYGKLFGKSTRVRFATGATGKYLIASTFVCAEAANMMAQDRYEDALFLLFQEVRGEDTSLEVLYNIALCFDALGHDDEAEEFFERVLVRAINLPSLNEAARIVTGIPISED